MAELAALNVKITGDASGLKAAANTATKSVEGFTKSAESSAKVFERAFEQSERSVDRLRRAIDPVYAASKKYESAVKTLDTALRNEIITQAQHARLVDQAGAAYLRTGADAVKLTGVMGRLGNMSGQTRSQIQNVAFNVADMAVQFQAGTRASVVFAQQGSQIASAFGPVGAVIGALAAIGIPALAFAFSSAAKDTRTFDDAVGEVEASLKSLQDVAASFSATGLQDLIDKYGELNAEILLLVERQRQFAVTEALQSARDAASLFADQMQRIGELADRAQYQFAPIEKLKEEFGLTLGQAQMLVRAMEEMDRAQTFEEMATAISKVLGIMEGTKLETQKVFGELLRAESALRQMAEAAPDANWLSAATAGAAQLAGALWNAAKAAAQVRAEQDAAAKGDLVYSGRGGDPRQFIPGASGSFGQSHFTAPTATGGGGGGGGSVNPIVAQLESLKQSLMTQEEAQIASFARQQETLRTALEQQLITRQEYQALMEDAQQQHSDKMGQIDAIRYGDSLQKAGVFFGGMADAFASGNEKMAKIGQKFAAVEALINAWRAYNQTLADPTLPWFAKFAAAAKVLAAGMGAVQAIKGAGSGGKGGGGAVAAANSASAPTNSTYFNVSLTGGDNFGKAQVRDLISAINKAIEDGAVIKGIRVA